MLVVIIFIVQQALVPLGWTIVGAVIALAIVHPDKQPQRRQLDIGPALRRRAKRNHHLAARCR